MRELVCNKSRILEVANCHLTLAMLPLSIANAADATLATLVPVSSAMSLRALAWRPQLSSSKVSDRAQQSLSWTHSPMLRSSKPEVLPDFQAQVQASFDWNAWSEVPVSGLNTHNLQHLITYCNKGCSELLSPFGVDARQHAIWPSLPPRIP